MLGKIEDRRRREWQKMRWLYGTADSNRHEFEQALGDGDGQGSLACCSPWDHKQSDMTEWQKNNNWHLQTLILKAVMVRPPSNGKWWDLVLQASDCKLFNRSKMTTVILPWLDGQAQRDFLKKLKRSSVFRMTWETPHLEIKSKSPKGLPVNTVKEHNYQPWNSDHEKLVHFFLNTYSFPSLSHTFPIKGAGCLSLTLGFRRFEDTASLYSYPLGKKE